MVDNDGPDDWVARLAELYLEDGEANDVAGCGTREYECLEYLPSCPAMTPQGMPMVHYTFLAVRYVSRIASRPTVDMIYELIEFKTSSKQ